MPDEPAAARYLPGDVPLHMGQVQPYETLHLHGKAISGHRHSHALRDGEDPDDPDHMHHKEDPDGPWIYPKDFNSSDDYYLWLFDGDWPPAED